MAWFEPDHYITEANAGFFHPPLHANALSSSRPDASVRWDGGQHLHTGPGAQRAATPAARCRRGLWLTYYRHIFNPARLKLTMMKRPMPTRYWQ